MALAAAVLFATAAGALALPGYTFSSKVQNNVVESLNAEGAADVFVKMSNDIQLASMLEKKTFNSRAEQTTYVYESMKAHMMSQHAPVHMMLADNAGHFKTARSFWITNSIFLEKADPALILELSQRGDVEAILPNEQIPMDKPFQGSEIPQVDGNEWGVDRIGAPKVWASGNKGENIVVANIDTGVRYTHEAIVGAYRGNMGNGQFDHDYNYFDAQSTGNPQDYNGHGSHVMGTMVGGNGIGVAPGAKWIAAVGCRAFSCSTYDLTASAEWMTCPTKRNGEQPDCSKAPHVINNSWGGGQNDQWYKMYVDAWHAAGIVPVFALGNSGPSCGTANSPGDYESVIGVGASNNANAMASFSSRGPTKDGRAKPNLTAPGENIRSVSSNSDNGYSVLSGTSMASPHVTGAVALLLAQNDVTYTDVLSIVTNTAVTSGLTPDSKDCGGVDRNTYPNNSWGSGLLNVCAATNKNGGSSAC